MTTTVASVLNNIEKFDITSTITKAPIDRTHFGGGYHKYGHNSHEHS